MRHKTESVLAFNNNTAAPWYWFLPPINLRPEIFFFYLKQQNTSTLSFSQPLAAHTLTHKDMEDIDGA